MTIKEQLKDILKQKGPRNYTKGLKSRASLLKQLINLYGDLPLPELFYLGLNNENPFCKNNKKRAFKNIQEGYRQFCGIGKNCPCRISDHSQKIKSVWDTRSDQQKKSILDKGKSTLKERYGVDNPVHDQSISEKIRKTNQEKYGASTPFESKIIQDKIKKTNQERYGTDTPLENSKIREKSKQTTLDRYGNLMTHAREELFKKYPNNPFADNEIKNKIKHTMKERYGIEHIKHSNIPTSSLEILKNQSEFRKALDAAKSCSILAEQLSVDPTTIHRYVHRYQIDYPTHNKSSKEIEIFNLLRDCNLNVKHSTRISTKQGSRELDIFLPDLNIAIEYCGLYWHTETRGRDQTYHHNKWHACNDSDINLITIFEDEYLNKPEIVKSSILNKVGFGQISTPARKLTVSTIKTQIANQFLSQYHIQGKTSECTVALGAFDQDVLVGVMIFKQRKCGNYELTRFASDGYTHNGMASKLLKYFTKNYKFEQIFSFADLRWSNGNLYKKLGFRLDSTTKPTYYYTDYKQR